MNKRYLHHIWRKLQAINPWVISALFLVSSALSIYSLRQNNLQMVRLRDAVYQADQSGGDVEAALRALREYVYSHMNTDLTSGDTSIYPPIQLKYTYGRLAKAEQDRTAVINSQIYTDAQNYCEQQIPAGLSGRGRIPCVQDYVASHGVQAQPIPDALYKFDFVSPRWSPDLAGWSLVVSAFLLAVFVLRLVTYLILKKISK